MMSFHILDTSAQQDLILLLYSETLPYTSYNPPGITVDLLCSECGRLGIDLVWRKNLWNKNQLDIDKILIYIGTKNKSVKCLTKALRNAFAHCNISIHNGMVYARCNKEYINGIAKGRKVFELYVKEEKLKGLLKYIKSTKS